MRPKTSNDATSSRITESRLRVRYAETDSMGIVYHANYLVWMEVGRTDYFRELGFPYRELEQRFHLHTPLVEASCRYQAPALYDDEIVIKTQVTEINRRLVRFHYQICRAEDNRTLAQGETVHLVVDSEHKRASFPAELMALFS